MKNQREVHSLLNDPKPLLPVQVACGEDSLKSVNKAHMNYMVALYVHNDVSSATNILRGFTSMFKTGSIEFHGDIKFRHLKKQLDKFKSDKKSLNPGDYEKYLKPAITDLSFYESLHKTSSLN